MNKIKRYSSIFIVIALLTLVIFIVKLRFQHTAIPQVFLDQKTEIEQRETLKRATLVKQQLQAGLFPPQLIKILPQGIQPTNTPRNFRRTNDSARLEKILASHTNTSSITRYLTYVCHVFLIMVIPLTATITVLSFWLIQQIYRKYDKEVNIKIADLYWKVNHLNIHPPQTKAIKSPDCARKRLITYLKDEIITINTAYIAYITLVQNTVSVFTFQNEVYKLNSSLDDLMKELDNACFFRANRQYIININAIENIWVYGRNQLRIETKPKSTDPIIISKNKVSEFKKWLDQ